jgi:hypothetical protein
LALCILSKAFAPPEGVALWWITIHFHPSRLVVFGTHSRGIPASCGCAFFGAGVTGLTTTAFGCTTTGGGGTIGPLKLAAGS